MTQLDHIAVCVTDVQASVDWYIDTYDASEIYSDASWGMVVIGSVKIALILKGTHPPHIALTQRCPVPIDAKQHRDGSRYIYDTDPDGNIIERIWWPLDVQ